MKKSSIPLFALTIIVLIWLLNHLAVVFYLYWTTSWYDIPMHFLGGLAIGTLAIWFFGTQGKSRRSFLVVFMTVMAIGIGWEIFEQLIGETFAIEGHLIDTSVDLLMDSAGAIVSYFVILRSRESL